MAEPGGIKAFVSAQINTKRNYKEPGATTNEGRRLFALATERGLKTTEKSIIQSTGEWVRGQRRRHKSLHTRKAATKKTTHASNGQGPKRPRAIAREEVMGLARLGAVQRLAQLLLEAERLRIFIKGVE